MPKKEMSSRERVIKAINHQIPDRVPIDLGGFQTGIHKKAYKDLIDYLGFEEDIEILDPIQQLAKPSEKVLEGLKVDTRHLFAKAPKNFDGTIKTNKRDGKLWHDLKDEFGIVWSMPDEQQLYMDISHHPLAEATIKNLDEYPFPKGSDPDRFEGVREKALELRKETPYAVCTGIGGVVYEFCWYMRGLEKWFMDIVQNPEFCAKLLDKMLGYWIDYYTGFLGEIGDLVEVIMIGDDIAGQQGPLFSPDFYRAVVKPRQKKLVQHIKSLTKAKIWYHTCGACKVYIPDLIDNGVDILNPIQIGSEGMDAQKLKDEYGSKIVFWGGAIDTQHILPFADKETVRREVKRNIEIFKKGGGYVFNNVHNFQAGVAAENIIEMYKTAYECGKY